RRCRRRCRSSRARRRSRCPPAPSRRRRSSSPCPSSSWSCSSRGASSRGSPRVPSRGKEPHDMAEINLRDVTKRYDDGFEAVKHMNLDIADGEFMILVGPSGCGKSTALRMIAGLEDITAGELRIGDEVVNDRAPKDRDIAMVFQNYALYPHMTVRDNMGFALKLAKVDEAEINKKVEEAARILDLEAHLDRKPANLSGGQ